MPLVKHQGTTVAPYTMPEGMMKVENLEPGLSPDFVAGFLLDGRQRRDDRAFPLGARHVHNWQTSVWRPEHPKQGVHVSLRPFTTTNILFISHCTFSHRTAAMGKLHQIKPGGPIDASICGHAQGLVVFQVLEQGLS